MVNVCLPYGDAREETDDMKTYIPTTALSPLVLRWPLLPFLLAALTQQSDDLLPPEKEGDDGQRTTDN